MDSPEHCRKILAHPARVLDQTEREFFFDNGYVIKERAISTDWIARLNDALARQQQDLLLLGCVAEVEDLDGLQQALQAGADRVLLDNFDIEALREAVRINARRAKLEASGNITLDTLADVAATGVDYISIGALTKDAVALDLSMRLL